MRLCPSCGRNGGVDLVSIGAAVDVTSWACTCGHTFEMRSHLEDARFIEVGNLIGNIGILAKRAAMAAASGNRAAPYKAKCDGYVTRLFEIFNTSTPASAADGGES